MLCVSVMTQCFSVDVVSQSATRPPTYKSHNQCGFGKTDGKPLTGRSLRGTRESGSPAMAAALRLSLPQPSDELKKPPDQICSSRSQYHPNFHENHFQAREAGPQCTAAQIKNNSAHISLSNECTPKKRRETVMGSSFSTRCWWLI